MNAAAYHALSRRLREAADFKSRSTGRRWEMVDDAADAIDTLVARVEQLEACLADTCRQLEVGGAG